MGWHKLFASYTDLTFDSGVDGRFIRVRLQGGKTKMSDNHSGERIITENSTSPSQCFVKLTEDYLRFLGTHWGSLQPNCSPRNPNKPHPSKNIRYSLALDDLRQVITLAG